MYTNRNVGKDRFKHYKWIKLVQMASNECKGTAMLMIMQPKMFYVQRVRSTRLWDFGAKAERVRTIAALRLARYDGQDGRFVDTLRTWRTDPKMHLERALSLEDTSICVQ